MPESFVWVTPLDNSFYQNRAIIWWVWIRQRGSGRCKSKETVEIIYIRPHLSHSFATVMGNEANWDSEEAKG